MKTQLNLTTETWDLNRYASHEELMQMLEGFDGVELMHYDADERGIITNDLVVGFHSRFFNHWLDFYQGNTPALLEEYGTMERCYQYYGGTTREVLYQQLEDELKRAESYGAEYMVLHVADCNSTEAFTGSYRHTHEEVVDALSEIVNAVFNEDHSILLLFENLWTPGLTLTRPDITKRLMDRVAYPHKGIMLDTGHLFHTNTALRTPSEGVAYVNAVLDSDETLTNWVKGVHLNQSVTGAYFEEIKAHPPILSASPEERGMQVFKHIYTLDVHEPFVAKGVKELIERLSPRYLTYEFITSDNEQQARYIQEQRRALA